MPLATLPPHLRYLMLTASRCSSCGESVSPFLFLIGISKTRMSCIKGEGYLLWSVAKLSVWEKWKNREFCSVQVSKGVNLTCVFWANTGIRIQLGWYTSLNFSVQSYLKTSKQVKTCILGKMHVKLFHPHLPQYYHYHWTPVQKFNGLTFHVWACLFWRNFMEPHSCNLNYYCCFPHLVASRHT